MVTTQKKVGIFAIDGFFTDHKRKALYKSILLLGVIRFTRREATDQKTLFPIFCDKVQEYLASGRGECSRPDQIIPCVQNFELEVQYCRRWHTESPPLRQYQRSFRVAAAHSRAHMARPEASSAPAQPRGFAVTSCYFMPAYRRPPTQSSTQSI